MRTAKGVAVAGAALVATEALAWAFHRFVMHGPGWRLHRSHHAPRDGAFEANDLYAAGFAGGVVALAAAGRRAPALRWAAAGITGYGALYLLVHDAVVHRRFGNRWTPRSGYARRLHQAHRLHHAVATRNGAVSFGFLYAPPVAELAERLRRSGHPVRRRGGAGGPPLDADAARSDASVPPTEAGGAAAGRGGARG